MYVKIEKGMTAAEVEKLSRGTKGYATALSDRTYSNADFTHTVPNRLTVKTVTEVIQELLDRGYYKNIGVYRKLGRIKGYSETVILAK